jgi:hypothetical protein
MARVARQNPENAQMPTPTWTDWLLELLCRLYKAWGGDCRDFNGSPATAITLLQGAYGQNGLPNFPTQKDRDDFINTLDALEAHLALSGNTLTSGQNASLNQLIADLRKDLGL